MANVKKIPITNRAQAASALRLRGHASTPAMRRAIIRTAAKYMPVLASKAWNLDKSKGLLQ